MKTEIRKLYAALRANPCSMLVGRNAEMALRGARIVARFEELAGQGLVRIEDQEEDESYFSVYGKPDDEKEYKRMCETLERLGCVCVIGEWFDGDSWHLADSIGMCVYENPLSIFENCYVVDIMDSTISALENHQAEKLHSEFSLEGADI